MNIFSETFFSNVPKWCGLFPNVVDYCQTLHNVPVFSRMFWIALESSGLLYNFLDGETFSRYIKGSQCSSTFQNIQESTGMFNYDLTSEMFEKVLYYKRFGAANNQC